VLCAILAGGAASTPASRDCIHPFERRLGLCDPEVATRLTLTRLTRIDFRGGRAYPYKVKVREIVRMLEDDGWLLIRTRGSHHQYKHPTKPGLVTIPGNRNDELAPGTLNSILKQAGLKP